MDKIDSSSWAEIKSLDERLERDPDSFCFARLSEIYLKVGLVADALHTARQGVAKHPGYLAGQRALAMACNANGLHEESLGLLEQVTAALPEDTGALELLARLYVEAGHTTAAIRTYTTLLDFNPEDLQSKGRLEELHQVQPGKTSQFDIPSEPEGYAATVAEEATEAKEAEEEEEEEIYELSEDDIVYDEAEEKEEPAEPPVADVPTTVHHDPLSTLTLAELYEQQGFIVKALDIYRNILADDPENAQLLTKISQLEQQESEAERVLEQPETTEAVDEQESIASATFVDTSAPMKADVFSSLEHNKADNVVATLDNWLENIRRIKACR